MTRLMDKNFWNYAIGRAFRTFLQGFVTLLGTDMVNIIDVPFASICGVACTMALVSICTSMIARLPEEDSDSDY